MCSVAKQHNIKIIVDVVANHVSIDLNSVSDAVDWLDRWKVTQRDMLRLYDLNTGDLGVQKMIKYYMEKFCKIQLVVFMNTLYHCLN